MFLSGVYFPSLSDPALLPGGSHSFLRLTLALWEVLPERFFFATRPISGPTPPLKAQRFCFR